MKLQIATALFATALMATACDNGAKPDKKITDAFSTKFSNATQVKWDKEDDNEWEAEFTMNGQEYSANFSENGEWMETEWEVAVEDVPQVVMDALQTAGENYDIEEVEIAEKPEGKRYEFVVEDGEHNMEIVIDTEGNVLKIEKETEGED